VTTCPVPPDLACWEEVFRDVLEHQPRDARVLLLSAGFGDGHNRAALALRKLLQTLRSGVEVRFVDLLIPRDGRGLGSKEACRYYAVLRRCPRAYHLGYRALARLPTALPLLARQYRERVAGEADPFQPDVIAATHVFCAWGAQRYFGGRKDVRTVGIVTDWLDDAYWNRTRLSRYLVATGALKARLVRAGIPEDHVHVTGLPVDPELFHPKPKALARAALGLDRARFTVLVLGGGLGLGGAREAAAALAHSDLAVQVVVVAGRNEELRSKAEVLKLSSRVPLTVVGFTERMADYLAAADLVVTKPGGMTVAECLAARVPIAFFGHPLPGPETLNETYCLEQGLAVKLIDAQSLREWVARSLSLPADR
jgi:processive 1,2-diacylglycerol beta-glucosyltransferase